MSWTYSGNPATSPLDEIRFLIGDTVSTSPILSNEEINYMLGYVYGTSTPPASGNFYPAALLADSIAAVYASVVDKSVGDLSISNSQKGKNFSDLAARLHRRATVAGVRTYAGGLSVGEKRSVNAEDDRVAVAITIDGMSGVKPMSGSDLDD